jgi:hypothetical protein
MAMVGNFYYKKVKTYLGVGILKLFTAVINFIVLYAIAFV